MLPRGIADLLSDTFKGPEVAPRPMGPASRMATNTRPSALVTAPQASHSDRACETAREPTGCAVERPDDNDMAAAHERAAVIRVAAIEALRSS